MDSAESNYRLLLSKLDEFIRKYYKNRLLRGLIYTAAILLSGYLLLSLLEYYLYLPVYTKTILAFLFLAIALACFTWLVIIPLLAYFRLGKIIDHRKAAEIIGTHFSNVKDKLLNTLQLHEMAGRNLTNRELILASIDQKIGDLQPVPFSAAINLRENRKLLKYILVPAALIMVVLIAAPAIFKDGTYRMVHYNRFFQRPAPFSFTVRNTTLQAAQNSDYELRLKMSGTAVPNEVYLEDELGYRYKLNKEDPVSFSYQFKNLQRSRSFRFYANGFYSDDYQLEVLPNPALLAFRVKLNYPSYLGKAPESLNNTGDLQVPEGTLIQWDFHSTHAELLEIRIGGHIDTASQLNHNHFSYELKTRKSTGYSIQPKNDQLTETEALEFAIETIPDEYPQIQVRPRPDSISNQRIYFTGEIEDDHGLTRLHFNYKKGDAPEPTSIPIDFRRDQLKSSFFYYLDASELGVEPGEKLSYYFEVFDNDGVNGSKSARSPSMELHRTSAAEQGAELAESREELSSDIGEAAGKSERIRSSAQKISQQLVQKTRMGFEEKSQLKELLRQQEELESFLNEIRQKKEAINLKQAELGIVKKQGLQEKQQELQQLFNKLLDDETRNMVQQLRKLLEENDKDAARRGLETFQTGHKSLERELDRLLKLFQQLEFDQLLQENIAEIGRQAEKQSTLAEQSKQANRSEIAAIKKNQAALNQEYTAFQKQLEQLQQKQEASGSQPLQLSKSDLEAIQKQQKESLEQLKQNKNAEAAASQQKAAQQMRQLSRQLQEAQRQQSQMEQSVNQQALRQLLDDLLTVSFDQEALMNEMKSTNPGNPAFKELAGRQQVIREEALTVSDSVYSLSKRIPQLSFYVNQEAGKINQELEIASAKIAEQRLAEVATAQQAVMTSANNLAVMLSEVLKQLEEMMKNAGAGQAKKRSQELSSLNKLQKELNQRLQQMQQGLQPGQRIPRQQSEQVARLARDQQAIRNALRQLNQELNKDGQGKLGNLDKVAGQMEQTETELYNRQLSQRLIQRQKEIMTRLLEAENAEKERDKSEQREARSARQFSPDFSKVLEEYQQKKEKQLELIRTLPPGLSSFYREKVNDYFDRIRREEETKDME